MTLTLLGAGNVATHLGMALQQAGHRICQVWSRTTASASWLADRLGCPAASGMEARLLPSDGYIISVKDDALEQVARCFIPQAPETLWLHTAGSMPLDILSGKGAARIGVFYPMQTFSKFKTVDVSEIPLFLESPTDMAVLKELAYGLSTKVYQLDSEGRRHLHLAAVFACNFVNHCYALSARVLKEVGVPFEVMLPLVDETARKVHELAPAEAQTGPAIRGDRVVMARHEALLHEERMREIYHILSESIQTTHD